MLGKYSAIELQPRQDGSLNGKAHWYCSCDVRPKLLTMQLKAQQTDIHGWKQDHSKPILKKTEATLSLTCPSLGV